MNRLSRLLDDSAAWWAIAALVWSVFIFGQAAWLERWMLAGWPRPSLAAAVLGIVFCAAFFAGRRWARWAGLGWILLVVLVQVINASLSGWSSSSAISLVCVAIGAGFFCHRFFFQPGGQAEEENENKPFVSLVLLLREPRYFEAAILASVASRAWGIDVSAHGDPDEAAADEENSGEGDASAFIVGESPLFMGKSPEAVFLINNFDRPYFDEPAEAAAEIVEYRTRQAILDHKAWLSVDVVAWLGASQGEPQTRAAYRLIGRLLAELADENVLAILDPAAGQIFCYDPETERKLRSEDPLAELRDWYYSPIISVTSDDPAMQAAVKEARDRWPEFVSAFERREADAEQPFAVKAPFGGGDDVEFMWVEVTGIENEIIYGILQNDPAGIPSLAAGDRVKVRTADLNDWVCLINDEPVGGFTMRVLSERAKGRAPDGPSP
jgi:uncharacterized protein YegJ (DUF2314 family)